MSLIENERLGFGSDSDTSTEDVKEERIPDGVSGRLYAIETSRESYIPSSDVSELIEVAMRRVGSWSASGVMRLIVSF